MGNSAVGNSSNNRRVISIQGFQNSFGVMRRRLRKVNWALGLLLVILKFRTFKLQLSVYAVCKHFCSFFWKTITHSDFNSEGFSSIKVFWCDRPWCSWCIYHLNGDCFFFVIWCYISISWYKFILYINNSSCNMVCFSDFPSWYRLECTLLVLSKIL